MRRMREGDESDDVVVYRIAQGPTMMIISVRKQGTNRGPLVTGINGRQPLCCWGVAKDVVSRCWMPK